MANIIQSPIQISVSNSDSSVDNPLDTGLFQRAIDEAAAAGGGDIKVLGGDYYINSPLLISHKNITIHGSGQAARVHCVGDYGDVFRCYDPASSTIANSGQGFQYILAGGLTQGRWKNLIGIELCDLAFVSSTLRTKSYNGLTSGNVNDPTTTGSCVSGVYTYSATGFNGAGWYDPSGLSQIYYNGTNWISNSNTSLTFAGALSNQGTGSASASTPFTTYDDGTVVTNGGGGTVSYNSQTLSRIFNVASPGYFRGGALIYALGCMGIRVDRCSFALGMTWAGSSGFVDGEQFLNCCYFEACDAFCVHDPIASFKGFGVYVGDCNTGIIDGNALLQNGQNAPYTGTAVYIDGLGGATAAIIVRLSEAFSLDYGIRSVQNNGVCNAHLIDGGFMDSCHHYGIDLNGDTLTEIKGVWTAGSGTAGIRLSACGHTTINGGKNSSEAIACTLVDTCDHISITGQNWQGNLIVDGASTVNVVGGGVGSTSTPASANIKYTAVDGIS